ncbi:lipopolysaccharide biosynthesis protein [Massilia sp. LXY-6]|uniref:lipopolysaccharide biosynthesis protein n=1 Tax=Massilia sp. LXY-6 TaxID=3379823 RepID=UPI003EE25978
MPNSGWHALKWNYLGNLARGMSQFFIGVLLARLLGPGPFGIVALAWMILGLGRLVADLGFGAALVQRASLSQVELRFIFTCQMAFALVLTGIGCLSAATIATYFHKPEATPMLMAMFFLFVIDCPGQTAAALLRRELNFKTVQQIGIASYLCGYVAIGIPFAYLGAGAWSLVAAQITQSVLSTCLLLRVTPVPLTPCFRCRTPGLAKFGLKVTTANLSSWAISNLDTVFIGRAFGVADLGLYSRALNLLNTPMSIIATGFQGVLFAACSRQQHDTGRLRMIYLETSAAVALVCIPVFATAALVSRTLVLGIYGERWEASVPLVAPLALAVLVNALLAINGPILMAGDQVGAELRSQAYTVLLFVPMLFIAVRYSMVATAWTVFAAYALRWALLTASTLRLTGTAAADYLRKLCFPAGFGLTVALVATGTDRCLAFLPALPRLLSVIFIATAASLLLAQQFGASFLTRNMSSLVIIERLSMPIRKFLNV